MPKKRSNTLKRNNWTDMSCYYVSIIDGKQFNVVAGPFRTHEEALEMIGPAKKIGRKVDPKSHAYNWGAIKLVNGYREGCLNIHLGI